MEQHNEEVEVIFFHMDDLLEPKQQTPTKATKATKIKPQSQIPFELASPSRFLLIQPTYEGNGTFRMEAVPSANHFHFHEQNLPVYAEEEKRCHYCQFRSWDSHKKYPISVVNETGDGDKLPANFVFIQKSIPREGVEFSPDEFKSGCDCLTDEKCTEVGCACLEDVDETELAGLQRINAYHRTGWLGPGRKYTLRSHMLQSRKPIYECHEKCGCSPECANRVVQRGRKVNLNIFKTSDGRGWGVRARDDLIQGQFVDQYVGEIITAEEASARRAAASSAKHKDVYLFALDKFTNPNSADPRLQGEPYEVDGEYFSGPTRFINHSCNPNLRIFAVVTDQSNKPFHQLAFFALEDITRETELTFDYTDGITTYDGVSIDEAMRDPEKKKHLTKCLCGSDNCRGYIW